MSDINVRTPRNAESTLTATITLVFPDGNITEHAVRDMCEAMVRKHLYSDTRASVDFERTVRQSLPLRRADGGQR